MVNLLIITFSLLANLYATKIEIVYPDDEVKTYSVDNNFKRLTLLKTKWSCSIGATKMTGTTKHRTVSCFAGKYGAGTELVCSNDSIGSTSLELVEDPKPKPYSIRLYCGD